MISIHKSVVFVLMIGAVLLLNLSQLDAAVYYVSSKKGSDKNNGRSPTAAWQTLGRAAGAINANDTLMVFRGSVFREANVSLNGGTLQAFGPETIPLPVLAGSLALSQWKAAEHNKNIFVTNCDKEIHHVFCDGQLLSIARFPNTGWLRTDPGSNAGQMHASALAQHPRNKNGYWNGANVRWRRWSWWFETRQIQSWDGNKTLRLAGQGIGPNHSGDDSGFYMDNKFEELDYPGEWFYDAGAKKLYVYPPKGIDIESALIEGMHHKVGLQLGGNANVRELEIRHFYEKAVNIGRTATLDGCVLRANRSVAVSGNWDANGSLIKNCLFEDNLNNGISWNENKANKSTTEFHHNTFNNTGMVAGYGGSGVWHACAMIITNANGVRVHHNRINGTGYCGIILGSPHQIVEYNVFSKCMSTLNDGAAIYTNCDASIIRHNIILDTIGENVISSHKWACLGQGIWPEFLSEFKDTKIINNTVVNSGCHGIFLHNNYNCEISGNVLFGNKDGLLLKGKEGKPSAQNHRITNNVFVAMTPEQTPIVFHPGFNYGSMSGNMFANPYAQHIASDGQNWGRNNMGIDEWLKQAWSDKGAKTFIGKVSVTSKSPLGRPHCFINDTEEPVSLPLSGTWYSIDKQEYKDQLSLDPYTSKALILGKGKPGKLDGDYTLASTLNAAPAVEEESGLLASRKKSSTRAKKEKKVKQEEPKQAVISDEVMKAWDARFQAALIEQIANGKSPYFDFMGKQYRADELSDKGILKISAGAQKMTYPIARLKVKDKTALSIGMAQKAGDEERAIAAFYLYANDDVKDAQAMLLKVGKEQRDEVRSIFEP